MLVVIFELILIYVLIREQKNLHRNLFLITTFLTQFTLLSIYRFELKYFWGREVYWSDAEYYWDATLKLLKQGSVTAHNIVYVYYSWLLQKTSPFVSVIWNNVSNLLLVNLSFLLAVETSRTLKRELDCSVESGSSRTLIPSSVYLLSIANPLVVYSLMRNLKDSLFLFLLSLSVFLVKKIMKIKSLIWFIIALVAYNGLLIPALTNIRPWGFAVPVLNMLSLLIGKENIPRKHRTAISFLFLLFLVLIFQFFSSGIQGWLSRRDLLLELGIGVENKGAFSTVLGIFRLLIGPGPIRSLFGSQFFQFYTYVGNISSFVGSTIFWFLFPYVLIRDLPRVTKLLSNGSTFFLNLTAILGIYAYFYGGSAELRFRGVIYSLVSFFLLETFPRNYLYQVKESIALTQRLRSQMLGYVFTGIFLITAGILFSI